MITRKEQVNEEKIDKYSVTSSKNIKFNCIDKLDIVSLLFGKYNKVIKKEVKNNEFIIIRLPSVIGIIACHYAKKYKKKYVIEMVGCPWDSLWNYGNLKGKIVAPIMYILNKYYIKRAPNVIYVSKEFLQNRYPTKGRNIGVSDVNIDFIKQDIEKNRLKKIDSKEEKNIYKIGLIGSLNVNFKGHDTAIKALSILNRNNIKIEMHFLGVGDKSRWFKLIDKCNVEENVYFDGALPGGESVYQWMDSIDLYWIPSLQEGLPRALVEAMSRGCPVVGTKTGGIPELIDESCIIRKKSYKQLARKTINIINNKEMMKKLSIQNFEKSLEFEKEKLEKERSKFYLECIRQRIV